jgi:hypothetical protein
MNIHESPGIKLWILFLDSLDCFWKLFDAWLFVEVLEVWMCLISFCTKLCIPHSSCLIISPGSWLFSVWNTPGFRSHRKRAVFQVFCGSSARMPWKEHGISLNVSATVCKEPSFYQVFLTVLLTLEHMWFPPHGNRDVLCVLCRMNE